MSASHCQRCGAECKTYWVNDDIWLCLVCFKLEKQKPAATDKIAMHLDRQIGS